MIFTSLIWRRVATSFFAPIAEFAVKHWKLTIILVLLAIIYNQNFMTFQAFRIFGIETIPHIKQDLELAKQDLATCEQRKQTLETTIITLNAQIDKWASVSGNLQQQHDQLATDILNERIKSEQRVDDILKGPTPESCDAAFDYLRDAATGDNQ